MPKIFDNIEQYLIQGLNTTLEVSYRGDFCVGYFNLRGWKEIAVRIDTLKGGDDNCCRLLIGMQKPPFDAIWEYFYTKTPRIGFILKKKRRIVCR